MQSIEAWVTNVQVFSYKADQSGSGQIKYAKTCKLPESIVPKLRMG